MPSQDLLDVIDNYNGAQRVSPTVNTALGMRAIPVRIDATHIGRFTDACMHNGCAVDSRRSSEGMCYLVSMDESLVIPD